MNSELENKIKQIVESILKEKTEVVEIREQFDVKKVRVFKND